MKKKLIIFMLILLGITVSTYVINTNNKNVTQYKDEANSIETNKINNENADKPYGVKIDNNTKDITSTIINEKDSIRFLHSFDKDKLFVVTEDFIPNNLQRKITIKIFNLLSGKTEKQIDIQGEDELYYFVPLNNGFYVIEINNPNNDKKMFYHIYDNELNLARTVDLSAIENKIHPLPTLSNNGDKVVYIDSDNSYTSIYTCDLDLNNKKEICKVEYHKTDKLSTFHDVTFMDGDKKVAFIGSIYINEDFSPRAFGTINLDGGDFNYKEHDELSNIIHITKGKTFFLDAETERGKNSSGQVFLVENSTGNINEYNLKDKAESQTAFISDKGNFIVTYLRGKSENNEPIYRLRIYDAKSKNIIKEFDTEFKGEDYLNSSIQRLIISEDNNSIYVAYRIDKISKIYEYKLN